VRKLADIWFDVVQHGRTVEIRRGDLWNQSWTMDLQFMCCKVKRTCGEGQDEDVCHQAGRFDRITYENKVVPPEAEDDYDRWYDTVSLKEEERREKAKLMRISR